jgi:Ser/Thr protein kinase RdoA (MazF antagonist)
MNRGDLAGDVSAFLATMVAPRSSVDLERAIEFVRGHYRLEVRAARLTGERDENFRLTAADGAEYVLKFAHPAEDATVTDLPSAALLHVEQADPGFPCPRVVRSCAGATAVRLSEAGGGGRVARLLTYLPGRPVAAGPRSARQRQACGRLGGRLSLALRSFDHPAAHRAHIWDVHRAAQLARLLGEVPDFPRRQAVAVLLQDIVPALEAHWPRLRSQVVHNDLNSRNVLVDPADPARVTGIIDFGDLVHTALIADVAVAAADLMPEDCGADAGGARESILDIALAYHETVPLLPEEWALLGVLVAARLVANLVVPAWHLHHNPAGGHYALPDAEFMDARLEIARQLLRQEIRW